MIPLLLAYRLPLRGGGREEEDERQPLLSNQPNVCRSSRGLECCFGHFLVRLPIRFISDITKEEEILPDFPICIPCVGYYGNECRYKCKEGTYGELCTKKCADDCGSSGSGGRICHHVYGCGTVDDGWKK